jgi:hypothetical protein
MDGPAQYELCIEQPIGPTTAAHFPEFTVHRRADGCTLLTATLPDQAALHGALTRIRDLGLVLVAVTRHREDPAP